VNILFTTTNDFLSFESQEHLSTWRKACHIVERLPFERITSYLLFDPASSLALVDAIVCAADDDLIMVPLDGLSPRSASRLRERLCWPRTFAAYRKVAPCETGESGDQSVCNIVAPGKL